MSNFVSFGKPIDDYCEALSLSFDVSYPRSAGGPTHAAQRGGFSFAKLRGGITQSIFLHAALGTTFDTIEAEFYRSDNRHPYLIYTMKEAVITSLTSAGNEDKVSIDFQNVSIKSFG